MIVLKMDSKVEKALQEVEQLMEKLNLSIEFYQNEIVINHNDIKYHLVNIDCGPPSRAYEIPRVTDGDRLLYDPEEEE